MDIFLLSLPVIFTFNMLYSHISCTYFTLLRHTCIHNNMTSFIIIHYEMYLCSSMHSCALSLYTLHTLTLYVSPMVKDEHKSNYSHVIHNLLDSLSFIPCIMMFLLLIYDIHFLYLSLFLYNTGALPGVWSTLTNLQELRLYLNQLTGKSNSYYRYLSFLPTSCVPYGQVSIYEWIILMIFAIYMIHEASY